MNWLQEIRRTERYADQLESGAVQVEGNYTKQGCLIYPPAQSAVAGGVEPGIDQRTATAA